MHKLFESFCVKDIIAACFVPYGSGAPVHTNRASHGIIYSVACSNTYRFDTGEVFTCEAGECLYLPKGSNYTVDKTDTCSDKHVGTFAINFLLVDNEVRSPFKMIVKNKVAVLSSFARAESAWLKKKVAFREICMSELYSIVAVLKDGVYKEENNVPSVLQPALEYIDKNYLVEEISIPYLAELCCISEVYLRRLFNKNFSFSPSVMIRNKRLEFSKELLKTGEYSISSVAVLSGFNDVAYFSREFKKMTGVSPNEYKKRRG